MLRQSRKLQHINQALRLYKQHQDKTLLDDVRLLHNCIPNLSMDEIDLRMNFLSKPISAPILINALTGGSDDVFVYNKRLAQVARRLHLPMAVGSQFSAIEKQEMRYTFEIVRKENPNGVILANVGAHATLKQAREVVNMIGADGLQIHINPAQELIMQEGDRDFRGYINNIREINVGLGLPVIVKETGCGMTAEDLIVLENEGVQYFDIGGSGGTNFLAIEAARANKHLDTELADWGIPTAASLLAAVGALEKDKFIIATGGINTPLQVAKALALGANMIGMAMYFLALVDNEPDVDSCVVEFELFMQDLKKIMLLSGCKTPIELSKRQIYIGDSLNNWADICRFERRMIAKQRR